MAFDRKSLIGKLGSIDAMAITAYREAGNQPIRGIIAVCDIIMNRRAAGRWGVSVTEVCLANKQFSCWNDGDSNQQICIQMAERSIAGRSIREVNGDPAFEVVYEIARSVFAGHYPNLIDGCLHYFNPSVVHPIWAVPPAKLYAKIGDHEFWIGVK